jgi:nuclear pore complex protein Nup160
LAGDDMKGLINVLPDAELPPSEAHYYHGIAQLFRNALETRWAVHFAELILTEVDEDTEVGDVWNEVFKGYLDLQQYDDAYSTLINMPCDEEL